MAGISLARRTVGDQSPFSLIDDFELPAKFLSSPQNRSISRNPLSPQQIYFLQICLTYPMPSAIIEIVGINWDEPPSTPIPPLSFRRDILPKYLFSQLNQFIDLGEKRKFRGIYPRDCPTPLTVKRMPHPSSMAPLPHAKYTTQNKNGAPLSLRPSGFLDNPLTYCLI